MTDGQARALRPEPVRSYLPSLYKAKILARAVRLIPALTLLVSCRSGVEPADLVLTGGVVWTAVPGRATAEAVAIRDGRILEVGSDDVVARHRGAATREIELAGRLVVPGLIDDHTHFMSGGFQLGSVDLRDAGSVDEFVRRLAAFGRELPPGRWITGGDWDHELWPGGELPHRHWIDSVTADHPVAVNRLDGHMILVNTRALELAGIDRGTPDPPGGTIVRDPGTGEATGVLKDEAMGLVQRLIPRATDGERDEAFRRAQDHALARGVTMVLDMGSWSDLETYRRARQNGELRMRIYAFVPLESWARLSDLVSSEGRGDERLAWGGLKGFVDGSLGSTTAWFYEPYADEPSTSGLIVTDTARLRRSILEADAAGLQVAVHAIGDRANDWLLDTYASVIRQNGPRDRRFRIEHAQHLSAAAIGRFAELGVLPSMQPYHAIDDGRWAGKRIGPDRILTTYAFRSLLDAGAHLIFGSDWTVAPIDPLLGIYGAVTRRTLDGANPDGWVPEQRITVEEALLAYTSSNAWAAFREEQVGALEPGMLADLVVLSENLFEVDPARLRDARVDYTFVAGGVVYAR